jgi:hypothetical protein
MLGNATRIKPSLGAQIRWGHPLAVGLVGAWLFYEADGPTFDLVSGDPATRVNGPTLWPDDRGRQTLFTAASDQFFNAGSPQRIRKLTQRMSLATSYRLTTKPATQHTLVDKDVNFRMDVDVTNGVRFFIQGNSTPSTDLVQEARVPVAGDDRSVLATYYGLEKLRLYINGLSIAQNSGTARSAITTSQATDVLLGRKAAGAALNGVLRYVYLWARVLRPEEALTLHQDPWAFLTPHPSRLMLWAIRSAGHGPLLAGARNRLVLA